MNHKEKSCQTSPKYVDKGDVMCKYLSVQREPCTHARARPLLNRELTIKDTSESASFLNTSNLADNKLSSDTRNNHDVSNKRDLFAANNHLRQSHTNFFQAADDCISMGLVKNHGDSESKLTVSTFNNIEQVINRLAILSEGDRNDSESKPTVSTFNNIEQVINRLAMLSEGDRNVFITSDWMKRISEKNCHETCKIQSFYSCQNKDAWTPKTVWVNKTCKPVIIPITLSKVHKKQQPQNCDCSVSKSHTKTSRSMETDEKNKNWLTNVDGKHNQTFHNQIKSSIKEQDKNINLVTEKCLSSVKQKQNSGNDTTKSSSSVSTSNFTVHLKALSQQKNDSFGDARKNSFSSQDHNNLPLFPTNSGESSKANKRCDTPSLASIGSIIQIVNHSIQNVINHRNDIEKSSSTSDSTTEQTDAENPKFMQISLPHPPREPVPRDSGGRYTHISTVSTSTDTSRTRPSVTISQHFTLPVKSIATDGTTNSCPSSLPQRISIKRFEDSTEAKVKRPMNAFMVWAKEHRPILANVFNGLTNSQISVKLGEMWNSLPKAQKQQYYDQAEVIKRQHKRDFPGWVYQPRPAKKRRESKYSLTNLFPSEEAMKEHMMSMNSYKSLSAFRAMNNLEKPSNTTSRNTNCLMNEITDEHKMSKVKSQKFVLEPIQVNPDNPKEFTCMMKPIEQSTANQTPQLVHVMPILKHSSEQPPIADNQLTRLDKLTTGMENVDTSSVMWSPMKANTGNKHQNRLRYPIRRLHMDFNRREFSSGIEDDDFDYEKIQKYCLESGIPHLSERSNSETSVELDRIFHNMANGNDEDNFDECSAEWLSAPEIEILALEKQTSD